MNPRYYPSPAQVDDWCARLLRRADETAFTATLTDDEPYDRRMGVRHLQGCAYVRFEGEGFDPFYGYWQPVYSEGPAPLLVHVPGYGAEMSAHPELVQAGFSVLHVNPLGYQTPQSQNLSKQVDGQWPVLGQTVIGLGQAGYWDWLRDALLATRWAQNLDSVQPGRLAYFGTSQGGGTALLLGSLMHKRGVKAVAADQPYLTDFALNMAHPEREAYAAVKGLVERIAQQRPGDEQAAWRAVGLMDTVSHAHRLTMPVLLNAGQDDVTCPADSVRALFDRLPGTRSYTDVQGMDHGYNAVFVQLALAWFRLFV